MDLITKNPASEGSKQDLIQIKNPATVGPKGGYDPKNFMSFLDQTISIQYENPAL